MTHMHVFLETEAMSRYKKKQGAIGAPNNEDGGIDSDNVPVVGDVLQLVPGRSSFVNAISSALDGRSLRSMSQSASSKAGNPVMDDGSKKTLRILEFLIIHHGKTHGG